MSSPDRLVVFDDGAEGLWPLTDLRASFEIRTGALTTLDRIAGVFSGLGMAGVFVDRALEGVVSGRAGVAVNDGGVLGESALLVNGRCVLVGAVREAALGLRDGQALVTGGGAVVAARLGGGAARALAERGEAPAGCDRVVVEGAGMLERAWDVVRFRDAALACDLEMMVAGREGWAGADGVRVLGSGPVVVGEGAALCPGVVLDATKGAVVIGEGAVVRPGAVVCGPVSVGAGSTVVEGAVIRGNTSIGARCKVGGEVSGVIFQGLSNKAHDGFAGDSYVGEWVNLGAGTVTSNLLNTYGEVRSRATPGGAREATGLTFLGSVIGDHAKTAIGTRLMTGSVVGTGAMISLSGHAPDTASNFAWLTDGRTQMYRLDRFLGACGAMMARRGVEMDGAMRDRLAALHEREMSQVVGGADFQI